MTQNKRPDVWIDSIELVDGELPPIKDLKERIHRLKELLSVPIPVLPDRLNSPEHADSIKSEIEMWIEPLAKEIGKYEDHEYDQETCKHRGLLDLFGCNDLSREFLSVRFTIGELPLNLRRHASYWAEMTSFWSTVTGLDIGKWAQNTVKYLTLMKVVRMQAQELHDYLASRINGIDNSLYPTIYIHPAVNRSHVLEVSFANTQERVTLPSHVVQSLQQLRDSTTESVEVLKSNITKMKRAISSLEGLIVHVPNVVTKRDPKNYQHFCMLDPVRKRIFDRPQSEN